MALAAAPLFGQQETEHLPTEPFARVISPSTPDEVHLPECDWIAREARATYARLDSAARSHAVRSVDEIELAKTTTRVESVRCDAGVHLTVSFGRLNEAESSQAPLTFGSGIPDGCRDRARSAARLVRSTMLASLVAGAEPRWGRVIAIDDVPSCEPVRGRPDRIVWFAACAQAPGPATAGEISVPLVRQAVRCRG